MWWMSSILVDVKHFKQSYTLQRRRVLLLVLINFSILAKNVTCFHGDSERYELATERSVIM
jgi:hypothetical protein